MKHNSDKKTILELSEVMTREISSFGGSANDIVRFQGVAVFVKLQKI